MKDIIITDAGRRAMRNGKQEDDGTLMVTLTKADLRQIVFDAAKAALDAKGPETETYNLDQAGKILNVHPQWLGRRVRAKTIPFHRLGQLIRFTRNDIDAILKSLENKERN